MTINLELLNADIDSVKLKTMNTFVAHCSSEDHFKFELKPLLEKAIAEKSNLSGICMIHLKDMAVKNGISVEALESIGIITNLKDFNSVKNYVLSKNQNDPNYLILLKRLKDGLGYLRTAWNNDKLANDEVKKEIDAEANAELISKWSENKITGTLSQNITDKLEAAAKKTANAWMTKELDSKELDDLVKATILSSLRSYKENHPIKKEVYANQYNILMRAFKTKGALDESFVTGILEQIKKEIVKNISKGRYEKNNPALAQFIKHQSEVLMMTEIEASRIVDESIKDWQGGSLDNFLEKEIETLVSNHLKNCPSPTNVTSKIQDEAIIDLIKRTKSNERAPNVLNEIRDQMLLIVASDLTSSTAQACELQNSLLQATMGQILNAWKKNEAEFKQSSTSSEQSSPWELHNTITGFTNITLRSWEKELVKAISLSEKIDHLEKHVNELELKVAELTNNFKLVITALNNNNVQVNGRQTNSSQFFQTVVPSTSPQPAANPAPTPK